MQEGFAATKPTDPTKEGWVFDGWATSLDASKVYGGETYDFTTAVTADITLYARWKKNVSLVRGLLKSTRQAVAMLVYYGGIYETLFTASATPRWKPKSRMRPSTGGSRKGRGREQKSPRP